jgi:predicted ATPase
MIDPMPGAESALLRFGDPELAATVVASMLGLSVPPEDATSDLIAYLRDNRSGRDRVVSFLETHS